MRKTKIENDEIFGITADRSTNSVSDNTGLHPLLPFILDKSFKPLREMIDKKFNSFFDKFISLSEHKDELKKSKHKLLKVFYSIVYQRISDNPYLGKEADILMNRKNENNSNVFFGLAAGVASKQLEQIVDEVFEIPGLVLTAFESSTDSFEHRLGELGRNYENLNNEHLIAVQKLKSQLKANRSRGKKHKEFYSDVIAEHSPEFINKIKREAEECRKNGNISYRELGRRLNVSHPTAKRWCKMYGIQKTILQLNSSSIQTSLVKVRRQPKKRRS